MGSSLLLEGISFQLLGAQYINLSVSQSAHKAQTHIHSLFFSPRFYSADFTFYLCFEEKNLVSTMSSNSTSNSTRNDSNPPSTPGTNSKFSSKERIQGVLVHAAYCICPAILWIALAGKTLQTMERRWVRLLAVWGGVFLVNTTLQVLVAVYTFSQR